MRGFGAVTTGTYAANVTAALQAGPRLYTLAIANDFGRATSYASREDGAGPELRLELAGSASTTSTTSTTSVTSSTTGYKLAFRPAEETLSS